jgi:hypothetical protein
MNHSDEHAGRRLLGIALCCALLEACGGGGDEGDGGGPGPTPPPPPSGTVWSQPPPPPLPPAAGSTATGVFRDSNVQGVAYESGALSGVTGADGKFQYIVGSPVTFRVGGVTLGSFQGQPFITPLHLPTSTASSIVDQIENRLRFLQMLDLDGNPENGIEISESTRTRAATWPEFDFTTAAAGLPAALATIRADAASADGGAHAIPAATAASEHFVRTVRCTYSGLYRGTYSGADTGVFAIVSYGGGRMRGMGYSTVDKEGFLLEKTNDLALSFTPDFQAGTGSNGATFSGEYASPVVIQGNWANGADTGTFIGVRSGGSDAAIYRISGFQWPLGTALVMTFEINAANEVTGSIIDLDEDRDGVPIAMTGALAGTAFTANSSAGQYSITGTFNTAAAPANRILTGTLRDNIKGRDVALQVPGCKLN